MTDNLKERFEKLAAFTCSCGCVTFKGVKCNACGKRYKYGELDYDDAIAALADAAEGVDREALWRAFLTSYLDNVLRELPESFRAKQLKNCGAEAALVHEFETRFLKSPFMKAVDGVIFALVGKAGHDAVSGRVMHIPETER